MTWTPEAIAEQYRKCGMQPPVGLGEIKRHKFNARRKEIDGHVFDSCAEARVYQELTMLRDAGFIADLVLQPRFLLQEAFRDEQGKYRRRIEYVADFQFVRVRGEHQSDQPVVVDVKGMMTPVFRMKLKMFAQRYPHLKLEIVDTRRKAKREAKA